MALRFLSLCPWSCAVLLLAGCGEPPWNNPYPASQQTSNIIYSAFTERPKHLDPARSYSVNEVPFTGSVYEPPLQYHYLERPYKLMPLTAVSLPQVTYIDAQGQALPQEAPIEQIRFSLYEVRIRPGIYYQPHPAFAVDAQGRYLYHPLSKGDLDDIDALSDFPRTGTRELVADDYIYQLKRLAHPGLSSPILGLMSTHIVGLKEYAAQLSKVWTELRARQGEGAYLDLTRYDFPGVERVDRYTYRIKLYGKYPQFQYWLAMPFFAPVPPEADRFYAQPGMESRNLTLDWYPVGTGPYMLTENNANLRMVLARNPHFHGEAYPTAGELGDEAQGLLRDAGRPLPFADRIVFSLEKEVIPYWNKFLQGYYDTAGVTAESFDQVIRLGSQGDASLTDAMREKGLQLSAAVEPSLWYLGFNMLDPVVGGYTDQARKLRQAISLAIDWEEFASIFRNGRGIPAQGPIPPGIFGHIEGRAGINPYVYGWVQGRARLKPIEQAHALLAQAGYPEGREAATGRPLLLYFDTMAGGPEDKARLDWMRKQFQKLKLQLVVRSTDYNRFQDKMRNGNAQIFEWGWNADYPDPENFLFLLYGPNGKVKHGGENTANYDNPEFNQLFEQMKHMEDGPERHAIIQRMIEIVRRDAPWAFGYYPKRFSLYHAWYHNAKPNPMANNTLKYLRVNPKLRAERREAWNAPVLWPLAFLGSGLILLLLPAFITYRRRETQPGP
jgi:ABC-type transport system substrate-binding protein